LTVAAAPLQPGDIALRIPEHLIVTLDRVLEDNTLAELLTTGKLSGEHPASPKKPGPSCHAAPTSACSRAAACGAHWCWPQRHLVVLSVLRPYAELACLTLYLAYEKKRGTEGCWYRFIKELDRMQGRGSQVRGGHQHATSAQALQPAWLHCCPLEALDADVTDGREEPCLLSSS
jgi:histone-lysine N-methyltransferase SETD3